MDGASALLPECGHSRAEYQKSGGFPNTDGIDPDGCQDVRIHDCTIDVGDDCIAIKSGTEDTPNRQVCERIIISNCHFLHGHGGVVLGSEMSSGIRNVVVSSCMFYETDRGIRLKTRRGAAARWRESS